MLSTKKLRRAWGALCIRYPAFQIFRSKNKLGALILSTYLGLLIFAILWWLSIPQTHLNMKDKTGISDGLVTTLIEIAALFIFGTIILLWKIIASSENSRIKSHITDIPHDLTITIPPQTSINLKFNSSIHYQLHPILETCYRWVEFDRDEYFLVEAGSLDIPKLSVNSITIDHKLNSIELNLSSSSFYDIFYTHYAPDLPLSSQSASEIKGPTATLRTLFDSSLSKFYKKEISQFVIKSKINCSELLPNPLGISGIVILSTELDHFILLRKRGSHEIAAQNTLEWSFAGLVEATSWIHDTDINFNDFVNTELQDEVIEKITALSKREYQTYPIGMVFNSLYLYQPEIFATVHYENLTNQDIVKINKDCGKSFLIIPVKELEKTFGKHKLKNLCLPGLNLLKKAFPNFFLSRED